MEDFRKYLDPKILSRITSLDLKARLIVEGFISGLHKSPFHGFSVEFAQHREYVPGDDIKHIDWKVFGKSDRYYIKQYEEETNLKSYILLDISESMAYGSGETSKMEYACYVAASLAYLMLQQQDSVGLVLFDNEIRKFIRDSSHPAHLKLMLHELEVSRPTGQSKLGLIFHDLAERFRRRGMVILISDLFVDASELLSGLRHFRHKRHEVIVFQILDRHELAFPFDDLTLFRGLENYPDLFAEPRSLKQQYLDEMTSHTEQVKRGCRQHKIDFMQLVTDESLAIALSTYLATRMGR